MHFLSLIFLFVSFAHAFDWQGHRGARGLYPENTIKGMKEALKWPVSTLELDVVISKDEQVVVSHEPWPAPEICHGGDEKKNFFQMTYAEIAKVDCGSKPHPRFPRQKKAVEKKPLLKDLILATVNANKMFNVEIKSTPEDEKRGYQPSVPLFSMLVMRELLLHIPLERFIIQSFDWRVLKFLHEKYPELKLSALDENVRPVDEVVKLLGFTPAIYSPHFEALTQSAIDAYQDRKIQVIPWTVNSLPEMTRLRTMGVDGIITDYPDLIPQAEKIPRFAVAVEHPKGWACIKGHQQWRNHCRKIKLPPHAHFEADGKTWVCDQGFKRYRGTCKKY